MPSQPPYNHRRITPTQKAAVQQTTEPSLETHGGMGSTGLETPTREGTESARQEHNIHKRAKR